MTYDLVAQDAEGQDVLLVEVVHGMTLTPAHLSRIFFDEMAGMCPSVPFGMAVDHESIYVQDLQRPNAPGSSCQLRRVDVFSHYDPKVHEKRVFPDYIVGLLDAWLSDLASGWFGRRGQGPPPGSGELTALGLAERLKGGLTDREVSIGERTLS